MKEYRRIFLSYALADAELASIISADCTAQGFEVWEYASRWKKEDLGFAVPEECAELIQRATWFVPVVSADSVNPSNGKYMVMEVEYASEIGLIAQGRVVPLLQSKSKPKNWFTPFDLLENLGVVRINPDDEREYLREIALLCRRLNTSYRPVIKNRFHLPFWEAFMNEVDSMRKNYPDTWNLMPVITEFDRHFGKRAWQQARELIAYFNESVRFISATDGTRHPPHALMVQAYCEIETGHFETAEDLLERASTEEPVAPELLGLTAHLHMSRKENYKARENLVLALARCSSEELGDLFYYLMPLIELGEAISEKNRKLVLDTDISTWEPKLRTTVYNARAILHYQNGRYRTVINLLDETRTYGQHDTTTIIYAHLAWIKLERNAEAESILTAAIRESRSNSRIRAVTINFYLAEFYLTTGMVGKTLTIYEKHLVKPGVITRRFAVQHARILKRLGNEKRTRTVCLRILGGQFPTPRSCEDFYYDGFANYLLGNSERAQYDFERSHQFDTWYPRVDDPPAKS